MDIEIVADAPTRRRGRPKGPASASRWMPVWKALRASRASWVKIPLTEIQPHTARSFYQQARGYFYRYERRVQMRSDSTHLYLRLAPPPAQPAEAP